VVPDAALRLTTAVPRTIQYLQLIFISFYFPPRWIAPVFKGTPQFYYLGGLVVYS